MTHDNSASGSSDSSDSSDFADTDGANIGGKEPKNSVDARVSSRVLTKIHELRRLETLLGHLPPDEWSLKDLIKKTEEDRSGQTGFHARQLEQQTELLFGDICDELSLAGLSAAQIAGVINTHLRYEGGPRYCSEEEVKEAQGEAT